jgi:cytochrome c1
LYAARVTTLADYPALVAQIARKNGPLAPESIAHSTRRRLWWRCPAGPDHLWSVAVANRTVGGSGCPFCAGRAVSVTNALSKVAPAVARQWHPSKNGALRARDVVAGSHRVAWWKCPQGPDHEWSAKIGERVAGNGCPFCSGRRATRARNLAVERPELAVDWHPTKNGALRPEDVPPGSSRKVWWRCPREHDYEAKPTARAKGNGCPFCSGRRVAPERSLAVIFPDLAREWDRVKNGDLTPRDVTMSSSRRVSWKCKKGPDHEWQTTVAARAAAGTGCPFCAGLSVSVTNTLATRFPALACEWHPTKNGRVGPDQVIAGANRRAWWRCASGHAWQAVVSSRSSAGVGCPYCANKRVSSTNSLAACFPRLAREWHPTKNGDLRPRDVIAGGTRRVWWRCASGHEWQAILSSRTGGCGCPFCAGHLATPERNLALASPELVPEWHPTRNGDLRPESVTPGSSTRVWWRCARRHEWLATPKSRGSKGTGCPFCAGNLVTPETSLAALDPAMAREWHPTKNRPVTPEEVTLRSSARVWWRCRKGPDHVWECRIADRKDGGCPFCSNKRVSTTNALAVTCPELAAQWDAKKNGALTPHDVTSHSGRRVWWRCPEGPDHAWQAAITDRQKGPRCPFCANKRVSVTNSLAAVYPKMAAEWHPRKNGKLTPRDVSFGTVKRVWWRCASGHEWQISVSGRTHKQRGCRQCLRGG